VFQLTGSICYDEAEISAGSFAIGHSQLVVGTFSGWAAFDIVTSTCIWSEPHVLPPGCDVKGIQFVGEDVLMLGYTRQQSFEKPANWDARLLLGRAGAAVRLVHDLPAGNWRMVRRVDGDRVYVYDVTEGQGLRSYDQRGLVWSVMMPDVRVVAPSTGGLVCLRAERLSILARDDGASVVELRLPDLERFCWTTASFDQFGTLIVGGYSRESKGFVIASVQAGRLETVQISEHPLQGVFSAQTVARAFEDECCGIDIFHVARIERLTRSSLLVALGGGGEELGACQSAAALGFVNLERPDEPWRTQVVDEHDGISGLVRTSERQLAIDFCGDLRFFAM
jgi:hypothetical protein